MIENQCEQTQNNSIDQLIDQFNGDPIDAKVSKKRKRERERKRGVVNTMKSSP